MTTHTRLEEQTTVPRSGGLSLWLKNLSIGSKLTMGFSLLVGLTLLVVGLTYVASDDATATIADTVKVRVPAALVSARAQANLLNMFGDVRGYLALGDAEFIESYEIAEQSFKDNLETLKDLSQGLEPENQQRLLQLEQNYDEWKGLPKELFDLHDDQMEREPAYAWLNTVGTELSGQVLIDITKIIEIQARQEPTAANMLLLRDMATFQGSYAAMFSGLRGYVTTRNPIFRSYEYEVNRDITERTWQELLRNRESLTAEQQQLLDSIRLNREQFITQVPDKVFAVLESDQWRQDLYRFDAEVLPLTNKMQQLLRDITESKQSALERDLIHGSEGLIRSRRQSLMGGGVAVLLGLGLALFVWRMVVGPIRRLTEVAAQIQAGNLTALAPVESGDEIGVFAQTFNSMTAQLHQTLNQVQQQKKRADDLLNVVIPIGVALSSERDFNRLLENMLVEAMQFCQADCGALFLREDKMLRPVMLRIRSQQRFLGGTSEVPIPIAPLPLTDAATGSPNERYPATRVVNCGELVNILYIDDIDALAFSGLKEFVAFHDYYPRSLLALPLQNAHKEVLGVLQLINAQDLDSDQIIPFDENLQQMMVSFSSLAAVAFESYVREQSLRQEIQQLRIEIDESKRQQQVSEIVETDFFQDLQAKARSIRRRGQASPAATSDDGDSVATRKQIDTSDEA